MNSEVGYRDSVKTANNSGAALHYVKEHVPEWRARVEAARKKNTAPAVVPAGAPQPGGTQPSGSQTNDPKPNGSQQASEPGNGKSTPGSPTSENTEFPKIRRFTGSGQPASVLMYLFTAVYALGFLAFSMHKFNKIDIN